MVFLISKVYESSLDNYLEKCQYLKTGEGEFVRQKYPEREFPIYHLKIHHDQMNHNLLFTLTLETVPERREIKEDVIIFHKGTGIQEELARIVQSFA